MTMFRKPTLTAVVTLILVTSGPFSAAQQPAPPVLDKWHSVVKTETQEAFVNASSIVVVGPQIEARVRQNFVQPQPSTKKDKTFLSSRTTFRFDCPQRRLAMKEVRTYAGSDMQGDAVSKATSKDKYLQWADAAPDTVYGKVLDYVCLSGPTG
jgi:hypothetical protein